jgi:DNA-binding NtrC family response regulator
MGGSMNIVDRKYKILLVDDEPAILSSVQNLFSDQNEIEIQIAKNAEEVMTVFNKAPYEFAVVLMDYNLAGISGADLTKEIIKINPHQIVAMYSGDESQRAAIESWRSGAVDFIEKTSFA